MKISKLYFYIHYCNHRESKEEWKFPRRITRKIQHHELLLVSDGKGIITVENKRYFIKKGMLFYFHPELLHSIETDIDDPMCFLSIHFSYAEVDYNDSKWSIKEENKLLPLEHVQELKDYYPIIDTFKRLIRCWTEKFPGYELICKAMLQQLLYEIFGNIKKKNTNYSTSLKVEKIIKYMHENINRRLTLTELSELVQLSPAYLSRTFKETTGYSVIEFFNKIKIDKGKEFISEGDKKIKEVAELLGFKDEFYFSRIFKKIEGKSPSEYYNKNVHGV